MLGLPLPSNHRALAARRLCLRVRRVPRRRWAQASLLLLGAWLLRAVVLVARLRCTPLPHHRAYLLHITKTCAAARPDTHPATSDA